jgi:hypothetical protein
MKASGELHSAIEDALSRVACELTQIASALERLETLVALIASVAVAK